MPGGFGGGPFGGVPWGGFAPLLGPPSGFDIYCFFDPTMAGILADPDVSTVDAGGQFIITAANDLRIRSGAFPISSDDAQLIETDGVPATWTLEFNVFFDALPDNFINLILSHVFVGATDAAGPCAGLFISKVGVAYAGAIHHDGFNNMVLDSPLQILAGSAAFIAEGKYITFRVAADLVTEVVYVFITDAADIPITGHQLRYILPVIKASDLTFPATDRTLISVRGTGADPSDISLDTLCLGTGLIMPNFPPRADAGKDQAVRACSIVKLDGTASFDPEGAPLTYQWRLIDAPIGSQFAFEGADGFTVITGTGFTDKFHSASLGDVDVDDPWAVGDVLLLAGVAYSIVATGTDGSGFFVLLGSSVLPDNLVNQAFKMLRQRGISDATTSTPTFLPDVIGIYKFDLTVSDGAILSETSVTIVNVLASLSPMGCMPDLSFVFRYLSDFWGLVEDRERIEVFFQAAAQVAASEMLTLWQIEYSKSLRDVQRTFQRRWLHYDLLLPEPLPELTRIRAIRGGVTSVGIPVAGLVGMAGTRIEITSPVLDKPINFQFFSPDPLTATTIATQLRSALAFDTRFSVRTFTNRVPPAAVTLEYVRIEASIPFTIGSTSNNSAFAVGLTNTHPSGTAGAGVSIRTYKTDRSLANLGITEGDLLIINGEGHFISRVIDDLSDELPFQRVVVKNDLPVITGSSTWSIPGHVTSKLLDFYNGLVSENDIVTFEVLANEGQSVAFFDVKALGTSADNPTRLGVDLAFIDEFVASPADFKVSLAKVLRHRYMPISDLVVGIPYLQPTIEITDPEAVLRQNLDYFLETVRDRNAIRFIVPSSPTSDVWEGINPPDRLWAETTYLDNRPTIEANFGIPAEFTIDDLESAATDIDYLSAVRGLWYALLKGPTLKNLRVGVQILLGLPFAEEEGTIEEIRTDFSPNQGRILIRDKIRTEIVRSYSFPRSLDLEVNPTTGERYVVGDAVSQFAPLVEGAEVTDWIKDPRFFEGFLNQGAFLEVDKFHRFMVRVDSAAFSLSTLMLVRNFILRVKPTYTFPIFIVLLKIGDTEVSVTDQVSSKGTLYLFDGACFPQFGMSTMFDQPRSAGGGIFSQFDADVDPDNPLPIFPISEPVSWGFDKNYGCPEDVIEALCCVTLAAPTLVTFDSCLQFDTPVIEMYKFSDPGPIVVPPGPAGLALTPITGTTVAFNGTIDSAQLTIVGGPGLDPPAYELVILVNAIVAVVLPFTSINPSLSVSFTLLGIPVLAGDTVTAAVRPAAGGPFSPAWGLITVSIFQPAATVWAFDSVLPAGTYCQPHLLTP